VNRTFYESSKVVDITGDNDNEAERVVRFYLFTVYQIDY